jgi:hypothetical protein
MTSLKEPSPDQQVLGGVAGHGQLGKRHQVAPGGLGPVVQLAQPCNVAGQVADVRVHLAEATSIS